MKTSFKIYWKMQTQICWSSISCKRGRYTAHETNFSHTMSQHGHTEDSDDLYDCILDHIRFLTHIEKKSEPNPWSQRHFYEAQYLVLYALEVSGTAGLIWCITSCPTSISSPSPWSKTSSSLISTTAKAAPSTPRRASASAAGHTWEIGAFRNYLSRNISGELSSPKADVLPSEDAHEKHSRSKQVLEQHYLVLWTPRTRTCIACISIHLLPGSVWSCRFL